MDIKTYEEKVNYSLIFVGLALFPAILIEGEKYRCLGRLKYEFAALKCICNGGYE